MAKWDNGKLDEAAIMAVIETIASPNGILPEHRAPEKLTSLLREIAKNSQSPKRGGLAAFELNPEARILNYLTLNEQGGVAVKSSYYFPGSIQILKVAA